MATTVHVGIEAGSKRVFACALDWPGWCRHAKDEASALEALLTYAPRFAEAVHGSGVRFFTSIELSVVERIEGNATTDFGAPDGAFADDDGSLEGRDLTRASSIMDACWSAFDRAVEAARGIELRKGPRGGGRELDAIVDHVVQAEVSYGRKLAVSVSVDDDDPWATRLDAREHIRAAFTAAAHGDMPEAGPRGGKLWTPRRFARRAAWHVLDHAWEIEDRARPQG